MELRGNRARRRTDKPENAGDLFLTRYARALQENVTRAGPSALASYTLIGAILVFGTVGYVLDRWLHTSPWLLVGGLLIGLIVGFYELAKVVWRR